MSKFINRRKFLSDTAISASCLIAGSKFVGFSSREDAKFSIYNIMKEVMKYRKIDAHMHVSMGSNGTAEQQLDIADRLGIERMVIVNAPIGPPEVFKANNDFVIKVVKQYPDRFIGYFTLNPIYQKESLVEINRCVDQGLFGFKSYTEVKINDPLFYPIIEKLTDLKMVVHIHSECNGFWREKIDFPNCPNASVPEDYVDAAKRYPETIFEYAHIGGGVDWEYACKTFKDYPNIYADIGGSVNEDNMIDFAVRYLGEDRIFFSSDGSYYQGVGNILASSLSEAQKKKIFFENYNNVLRKGGRNVD